MPNNGWLRFFFVLVFLQALLLAGALVRPTLLVDTLPWPASPLDARFIAALYWMGAVTAILCVFVTRYAAQRIPIIAIGFLTGGLLLLTLPHLGEFTSGNFPYRWMGFYSADVIVVGVLLWRLRGRDRIPAGHNAAAPFLMGYAALMGVAGVAMLAAPSFAVRQWPWTLTPILAQVYSIFFLAFAAGCLLAARDPRVEAGWVFVTANLVMVLLVLGVSAAYPERFKPGLPTSLWYAAWAAAGVGLAGALVRMRRVPAPTAVTP